MTSRPPSYNQNNNQNYFVNDAKMSSTRVLQAPGGASSITLSWEGTKRVEQQEKQINVSNNKFASGNSMNCGNVLTERPSSRVLHPPGGKSSITFG